MFSNAAFAAVATAASEGTGCRVLDRGDTTIPAAALALAVASIIGGDAVEVGRDRNAVCYRVALVDDARRRCSAIVKVPRDGPQRTNADATFSGEARVLARLPAAGIRGAPRLLARIEAAGVHFLFTTELPGRHPHPASHPLDAAQLRVILDHLFVMDRQGFMHYDLKAANILTGEGSAAFIDFEFAQFAEALPPDAETSAAFCRDFNVGCNPLLRMRSNVANFEFRTLHRYLLDQEHVADAGEPLLVTWLRARSTYHRRMAASLGVRGAGTRGRPASRPAVPSDDVRAAAAYERLLASLFEQPRDEVLRIERALMAFRCGTFERDAALAARARQAVERELDRDGRAASALPPGYAAATRRVLDLVESSTHPDTRKAGCESC